MNGFYLLTNNELPLLRQAAEYNRDRAASKAGDIASLAKKVASLKEGGSRSSAGRVLLYGVGFKKGDSCLSNSPALAVAEGLTNSGVDVAYVDDVVHGLPYLRMPSETLERKVPTSSGEGEELLLDASFDVIVVAHKPDALHRAVFDQLRRCQVLYFAK